MFWSFLKSCTPSWNVFRNFCKSNKVVSLDTNGTKQVNESSIDLIGDSINQINKGLSIKGVYKTYDEIRNELSGKNDNFGKLFLEIELVPV